MYDLRRSLSHADREGLYLCLSREERQEFARVAIAELSTLVNYTEQQKQQGKVRAWAFLRREARMAYLPSNPEELLRGCSDAWKSHLAKYGWNDLNPSSPPASLNDVLEPNSEQLAVLVSRGLRSIPEAVGQANPEAVPPLKGEVSSVKQEKRPPAVEPMTAEALEAELTIGATFKPLSQTMCDLPQVVRGVMAVCHYRVREPWTADVGLLNAGNEQRARLLRRQMHVGTILAVVYSDNPGHWALLVVDKGTSTACLYDGLGNATCADMARAFLLSDEVREWAAQHISLCKSEVAAQPDAWSCGHRVIATADLVLEHLAASGSLPRKLQGPTVADVKKFIPAASNEEAAPAAAGDDPAPVRTPKRARRAGSAESPVSPMVPKVPRRGRAESTRARSEPPAKKVKPSEEPARKMKPSACPISHARFQKQHCLADLPAIKGHWGFFLEACEDPSTVTACPVCVELLKEVRPGSQTSQLVLQEPGDVEDAKAEAAVDAVVPVAAAEDASSSEAKGNKRGRPRRGEVKSWCLAAWVRSRRSDVYVQTDRSLLKSATYFCRACNKEIQFQTQSCKKKVLRHESYQSHIKGLAKLRGTLLQAPSRAGAVVLGSSGSEPCCGIMASKHPLKESIESFVQHGQPRMQHAPQEKDPLEDIRFEVLSQDIGIRSAKCQGQAGSMTACGPCVQAAKEKGFKAAVAKMAYTIDLCLLTFHSSCSTAQEFESFKASLKERDYYVSGLAGQDWDRYLKIPSKLDLCRAVASKLEAMPAWRVSASLSRFFEQWLKKPHRTHSTDTEAEAYTSLVRDLGAQVLSGKCKDTDLQLASRVAAGALRSDAIVESLVTSFLSKMHCGLQSARQTTSAFADYEALSESLGTLGRSQEVADLLRTFKVNPKKLQALSMFNEKYPLPYAALSNLAGLQENCRRALSHLRMAGSRPHLIIDETTWAASWSQVRHLTRGSDGELHDAWVGGAWSLTESEDYSILDPASYDKDSLPQSKLAKLAIHVCVQRPDSRRWLFDICVLPRAPGVGSAHDTLEVLARVFEQATISAGGVAPSGAAFDGGSSNNKVLQAFLGQLPPALLQSLPFFRECILDRSLQELPFWPHAFLRHEGRILLGFNGAYHLQKRFSLAHLAGCRKIRHGGVFTELSIMLSHGLPHAAYLVADAQSDLAAAQRSSPPFLGKSWLSLGALVHASLGALICAATTASIGYNRHDLAHNAITALYLLLLHRSEASRQWLDYGERCRNSLSVTTLKNAVALMHFTVVCCLCSGAEPKLLQELGIEQHFGRLKAPFRGSPSLKDFLIGHRSLCARQVKQLNRTPENRIRDRTSSFDRDALDLPQVKSIAMKALRAALEFQSYISEDCPPSELYADLAKWWKSEGQKLFQAPSSDTPDDRFELFDILPEAVEDLGDETAETSKLQVESVEALQMVQDRAQVLADIKALETPEEASSADPQPTGNLIVDEPMEPVPEASDEPLPTNLGMVLQAARINGGAIFDMDSAAATGQQAMLERIAHMSGFLRTFIRHARVQEALLSPATLNSQPAALNAWNEKEHMLAVARRAANVSQARLSRAQAWHASQQRLAQDLRPRNGAVTENDPGMIPPECYFPYGTDRFQILVHLLDGKVCLGLVLSAFRGALVRKPGSTETTVRTARPFPDDLPSASTKMLHLATCVFNPSAGEYCTSCAERCLLPGPMPS